MVWAGVSQTGKTNIYFCKSGLRINSVVYQDMIRKVVLPQAKKLFPTNDWIFQQDSAPAHRSRSTQQMLTASVPHFIKQEDWPSNSPDLNPLDYRVWACLKEKVYAHRFQNETELKCIIQEEWKNLPQILINSSIVEFRKRVQMAVYAKGGHIEQLLK
jgi:inhibitor of nuclear factor kappa-B kinase subunit alpha